MRLLLTLFLLFLVSGNCTRRQTTETQSVNHGDGFLDSLDYSIIKYDNSDFSTGQGIFTSKHLAAELTHDDIFQCEKLLDSFLVEYNRQGIEELDSLRKAYPKYDFRLEEFTMEPMEYGRQYIAVIAPSGEKIVYVNCFCDPLEFPDRSKSLVWVDDGGKCYFNFKVDLSRKRIYNFQRNGVG